MADNDGANDNSGGAQVQPPIESKGQPLSPVTQHAMETAMSVDFSDVRVHEGHEATMLGAKAFTSGSQIFFAPSEYQPHQPAGQELLAHELTHVLQQRQGGTGLAPGLVKKP